MGRWRRHIYQGVADTIERKRGLPPGTMLETAWEELDAELQHAWLWGTGDEHITFTWRERSVGLQIRRQVRGHHSASCWRSTAQPKPHPAAAVGKIHERRRLRRLRRAAA